MAEKKKKMPKRPKAPKSTSANALASYERRIQAYEKKCADVKKHNGAITARKKKKEALTERARKAAERARVA